MAATADPALTPTWLGDAQWDAYERVGLRADLGHQELVLNWPAKGVADLDVYGAMTAVGVEQTIEGAPTITVTLRDPNMRLLSEVAGRTHPRAVGRPGAKGVMPEAVDEGWEPLDRPSLLGRPVDVELDGVVFRLVGVSYSSASNEATLTFEHRLVFWLRTEKGARRASRGHATRAQFILALVREVASRRFRFVCPELYTHQPIATGGRGLRSALGVNSSAASGGVDTNGQHAASGFAKGAHITVKGRAATGPQRRVLDTAMSVCDAEGAGPKARKALVLGLIEESECKNLTGGDRDSSGVLQVRTSTARGIPGLDPRDVAGVCRHFLRDGYWRSVPKGAIELAKEHPDWTAGRVTQECQGSAPGRYDKWSEDGDRILAAWAGTGAESGAARGSYIKSYQFARGANEDSWTAIQRLAGEVGWRCFVVGNSVYYMSEPALYRRRPRLQLDPDTAGVLDLSYDMDWGKPVSEATLQVVLPWKAPPGSVVVIDGYGPPDGRWLVAAVSRDYFGATAQVTLKTPGPAKREPAHETGTTKAAGNGAAAERGDASKSGRVYAAAKSISSKGYPYVWGGGHARAGKPDGGTGRDPGIGYDCSGSVCAALAHAGLGYRLGGPVDASGTIASSWGKPGRGQHFTVWANGGHVWIQFHGEGFWRFDTSSHGDGPNGARVRHSARDTSGFVARHWPGC
jgi:hypothetical protein